MPQLKLLFLLFTLTYQLDYYTKCDLSFEFRDLCFRYDFIDSCVPWDLSSCTSFQIMQNDFWCPILDCSVSCIIAISYSKISCL